MLKWILVTLGTLALFSGCASSRSIRFADRQWHISNYYGQIIDRDTTYRMTFGNGLVPSEPVIISCKDSADKYPGMDELLADILHACKIDSAEILFYVPEKATMFVKTGGIRSVGKPNSISSPMPDEKPYTMWVHEDDMEKWERKPTEMYTYYHYNKRKRLFFIADFFDYGDTPMAQITMHVPLNKKMKRMKLPESAYRVFCRLHDMRKMHRDIEFWSDMVKWRRENAFGNYKIGQEQKSRMK